MSIVLIRLSPYVCFGQISYYLYPLVFKAIFDLKLNGKEFDFLGSYIPQLLFSAYPFKGIQFTKVYRPSSEYLLS